MAFSQLGRPRPGASRAWEIFSGEKARRQIEWCRQAALTPGSPLEDLRLQQIRAYRRRDWDAASIASDRLKALREAPPSQLQLELTSTDSITVHATTVNDE